MPAVLETGCASLDRLLGGGFPVGSLSTIYGQIASGKTLLSLQVAINAARKGRSVLYLDPEDTVRHHLERLQIRLPNLVIGSDRTLEGALASGLAHLRPNALLIVDNPKQFPSATASRVSRSTVARTLADWIPRVTRVLHPLRRQPASVLIADQAARVTNPQVNHVLRMASAVVLRLTRDPPEPVVANLEQHRLLDRTGGCQLQFTESTIEDKGLLEVIDRRKIPTRFQRKI